MLESVVGESSNRGGEAGWDAAPDSAAESAARRRERASGDGGTRGL